MKSVFIKEIRFFFGSLIGYVVIGAYLILNALLLWFLETKSNILITQIAVLDTFFIGSAWLFMFVAPALCMGSFSEEIKSGTLELLLTKPISLYSLVLSKWLAALTFVFIALLPTLLNVVVLVKLLPDELSLDVGRIVSGYLGLFLIIILFCGISLFFSTAFSNQVTVFVTATLVCFAHYYLWGQLAVATNNNWLYSQLTFLGLESHLKHFSSGLIKMNSLMYFLVHIALILYAIKQNLKRRLEI